MLRSTNKLTSPIVEPKIAPVRLVENPFILTQSTSNACKSVAEVYDLRQYRNQFHSIKLENNVDSWLLELLKIDEGEGISCY